MDSRASTSLVGRATARVSRERASSTLGAMVGMVAWATKTKTMCGHPNRSPSTCALASSLAARRTRLRSAGLFSAMAKSASAVQASLCGARRAVRRKMHGCTLSKRMSFAVGRCTRSTPARRTMSCTQTARPSRGVLLASQVSLDSGRVARSPRRIPQRSTRSRVSPWLTSLAAPPTPSCSSRAAPPSPSCPSGRQAHPRRRKKQPPRRPRSQLARASGSPSLRAAPRLRKERSRRGGGSACSGYEGCAP
mmetsp:Transcript_3830/g.8370  ORF Transcript_3830/g.8370 Transcript_3830/m.8370 type:complete len:250 (+) Transcript_3830:488-1237(+)